MKTFSAKPHEVKRDWFVVDATDKVLGRLATEIARRLRGKHKPEFTPHVDTGDFIVVVNVEKLRVTGNKAEDKKYYRHTGYPGGIYETNFTKLQQRFPGRVLETAVKGMLPKGPLGYAMLKKLKCYAGGEHPHTAQQPKSAGNLRDRYYGNAIFLRYRPSQDSGGACIHQGGKGRHRRQRQAGR